MVFSRIWVWVQSLFNAHRAWQQRAVIFLLALIGLISFGWIGVSPALAGLNDDRFEGNIFALYAGNGSIVPPKVTLASSFQRHKPALLVFYVDDSRDCKQFASVVSQLQAFYGRATDFIPVDIDALSKPTNDPKQPGSYYEGLLPQTVLLNQSGKVVLNESGRVPFERIDDVFREVFDLLPRSESVELKRRPVNEINTELVQQ